MQGSLWRNLLNVEAHKKLNEEKNRLMNGKSQQTKDILTILPGLRDARISGRTLFLAIFVREFLEKNCIWISRLNKEDPSSWLGLASGSVVKNPPANAGGVDWVPRLGRSPGGNGSPLQYSCLENPMDRGAWQAPAHGAVELDMTGWVSDMLQVTGFSGFAHIFTVLEGE